MSYSYELNYIISSITYFTMNLCTFENKIIEMNFLSVNFQLCNFIIYISKLYFFFYQFDVIFLRV